MLIINMSGIGVLIAATLVLVFAGRDKAAYDQAKRADSVEAWTHFIQKYPKSALAAEATERISRLEQIRTTQKLLEGTDAVAKTKAILKLQKVSKDEIDVELVPALIAILSDDTGVQIPENVVGADVMLSRLGRGSVISIQKGSIFPTETGIAFAGDNAVLRASTPGDEAKAVLVRIAGKDFGADVAKWEQWSAQRRNGKR